MDRAKQTKQKKIVNNDPGIYIDQKHSIPHRIELDI